MLLALLILGATHDGYVTEGWDGCRVHGHMGLICNSDDSVAVGVGNAGLVVEHPRVFRAAYSFPGVPSYEALGVVPTFEWWGDDPTGAGGYTTETFAPAGSPASEDGPFGREVTELDGSSYYTHSSPLDAWDGDRTIIFVARTSAAGNPGVLALRGSGSNTVLAYFAISAPNSYCRLYSSDGTNSGGAASSTPQSIGPWVWCAIVYESGVYTTYSLGRNAGTPLNAAAWTYNFSTGDALVGSDQAVSSLLTGAIAHAAILPRALSASEVAALYYQWAGLSDLAGSAPTCTTTGPICAWDGGELECYSDDWCPTNGDQPPGLTGAGPKLGLHTTPSYTNQILQSRDLTTSWTATGTSVVSCSETETPYRDGRATCLVTDDDGSGAEYLSQVHAWAAASTGSRLGVCVAAQADSPGSVDLQIVESTSCGGSTVNYTALAVTTDWQLRCWAHTVADGACTDFTIRLSPTSDITDTSATGAVRLTAVQAVRDIVHAPSIHCPTTTSAVTCGAVVLRYPTPAQPNRVRVAMTFVPATGAPTNGTNHFLFGFDDTGATTADWGGYISFTPGYVRTFQASGSNVFVTSGGRTWTAGTSYALDFRVDTVRDVHSIRVDGTQVAASTTAALDSTSADDFYVGSAYGGVSQADGWISDVRVWR